MADGNVFDLVSGVLGPIDRALRYLFYAGLLYGARNISKLVIDTCGGLRTYFIPLGRTSTYDLSKKYGKWAVITGGTSGIGLAYAYEFAKREMNVVLISRSYDDLVNIISDLQTKYNIQTYGIYADFSLGAKVYQDVEDTLKDLEIGILVNDVAIRYEHPQYFALVPHQRVWQIIDVNVTSITVMTHMILPQMLKREKGAIINVCSVSSCTPPIPLTAEHCASMAYVDSFSQALHHENRYKGIFVQTLLPCFVAQHGMTPTIFTPSAETYVSHAISTLGITNRLCGYWPHAIQYFFCCLVPRWMWVWFTRYVNAATRRRCLAERESNGGLKFSREAYQHTSRGEGRRGSTSMTTGRRNGSDLSFRRTPSPKSRKIFVELSPTTVRRHSTATGRGGILSSVEMRRISMDEISRSRSSSTGSSVNLIPPINENSSPSTPEIGKVESPGFEGAMSSVPKRSSSSDPQMKRFSTCKRTSRVMVMPSVARISYSHDPAHESHTY